MGSFLGLIPLAKMGLGIIDKLVVDKDKKAEYAFNWNNALLDAFIKLATMKTVPWVDSLVKIMFALVAFGRPIGSFILSLKGLNMIHQDGGHVDMVSGTLAALFPGWMAARQVDKNKQAALKEKAIERRVMADPESDDFPFW